jgi:hypothetical protein
VITVLAGVGVAPGVGEATGVGVGFGEVFVADVGGAVVLEGDAVFPPQATNPNIKATMIVKD